MDHVVSSLIPSLSPPPLSGSSQARSPGLSGNLPCDIWLPALRQKVKGGPGAHFMEMQKSNAAHISIQQHDYFSHDVSRFGCSQQQQQQAAAHQRQELAQVETFERTFPRRSNQKSPMSKKIFPWMKESRHSDQKHGRRIAGLYDIKKKKTRQRLSPNEAFSFTVNGGN